MRLFTSICFFILAIALSAQTVITNQIFPAAGDTLRYTIDNQSTVEVTIPGPDQSWDLTELVNDFEFEEVYLDASAGMASDSFPDADLVLILGENNERYFSVSDDCVEEIALVTSEIVGDLFNVSAAYTDPIKVRRAPVNYTDTFIDDIGFGIAFDSEEIPDTLLELLPFVPDSIRLSIQTTVEDTVDAWGALHLPGQSFDALRIKSVSTTDLLLELKVIVWIPIPLDDIPGADSLFNALPQTNYSFVSNDSKEVLANMTVNEEGEVQTIQYKNTRISSSTSEGIDFNSNIQLYPNPASDILHVDFQETPDLSGYKVYNSLGFLLQDYDHPPKSSIHLNISDYRQGIYFLHFYNHRNELIAVRSFVKI